MGFYFGRKVRKMFATSAKKADIAALNHKTIIVFSGKPFFL
jgi:hypothetical protein